MSLKNLSTSQLYPLAKDELERIVAALKITLDMEGGDEELWDEHGDADQALLSLFERWLADA